MFDLQIPRLALIKDWAILEPGNNLMVYFLVLLYMSVIGFTTLYVGVNASSSSAFSISGGHSVFDWLYYSITTMATIGENTVAPRSTAAHVAVVAQLTAGPLLLSWLIAALATRDSAPERYWEEN